MEDQNRKTKNEQTDGGYGWIIVISGFFIGFITDGLLFSGGILLVELLEHFLEGRAETMSIFSIMFGVMYLLGPVWGALTDRYGCRVIVIIGAIISSIGFVVSSFATNIVYLCFSYGLLGGIGFGMMYTPSRVCVLQHFNQRRTLANGIAVCGSGLGTLVFNQLARTLIDYYNWRGTILLQAGIALHGVVFGLFLVSPEALKKPQIDSGLKLKIFTVSIQDDARHNTEEDCYGNNTDINHEEYATSRSSKSSFKLKNILNSIFNFNLLKDFRCWLYLMSAFTFTLAYPVPFNLIPDQAIETGMTRHQAAWLISSIGITNTVGRVFFGLLGDIRCVNRMTLLQIVFVMSGLTTGLSIFLTSFELKMIYTSLYGFLTGGYMPLNSVVLVDLLGAEIIAKSFGLCMFFVGLSGFIATPLGGFLFDKTGNYNITFIVAGVEFISGALILLLLRVRSNKIRNN